MKLMKMKLMRVVTVLLALAVVLMPKTVSAEVQSGAGINFVLSDYVTVIFHDNWPGGGGAIHSPVIIPSGGTVGTSGMPDATPPSGGFAFVGWFTVPATTGGTQFFHWTPVTISVNVYARWSAVDGGGGGGGGGGGPDGALPPVTLPPVTAPGNVLFPDAGEFIELDPEGVPLGVWTPDDDGYWEFEEERTPLGRAQLLDRINPQTGALFGGNTWSPLNLLLGVLGAAFAVRMLIQRRHKKEEDQQDVRRDHRG